MTDFAIFNPKTHITREEAEAMVAVERERAAEIADKTSASAKAAKSYAVAHRASLIAAAIRNLTPADARAALERLRAADIKASIEVGYATAAHDNAKAVADAVAAERERCARIAGNFDGAQIRAAFWPAHIATAIRKQGGGE